MTTFGSARIRRLMLTNFRSYRAASLAVDRDLVVLVGPNGAGKTNLIEAISFFAPGRGLRRAALDEVALSEVDVADESGEAPHNGWAVVAEIEGALGIATLGTGIEPPQSPDETRARKCRIARGAARTSPPSAPKRAPRVPRRDQGAQMSDRPRSGRLRHRLRGPSARGVAGACH